MKIGKYLKITITVLIMSLFATMWVACSEKDLKIGPYYAEYGKPFSVPVFDGETTVKDAEGYSVDISNGRFYVDSTENYTIEVKSGGATYSGEIIVITDEIPVISLSFDIKYGKVNTQVALPEVTAYVGNREVSATMSMKKGETEIDISEGFIPTETGEYSLTVTAVSGDKTSQRVISYYIEETDAFADKIASFDKPYGVKHVKNYYGISSSYSTEMKYGDEAGSTKITISTAEAEHEAQFAFGNFHIKDWTELTGLRMYVYNDNNAPVSMCLNWSNSKQLLPGVWTQVYIPRADMEKLDDQTDILGQFRLDAADGINAEVMAPISGKGTFSLYFSGFYAGEKDVVSPAEISEKIVRFNALEKADYELKEEIEKNYAELSVDQQAQVEGYEDFRAKCLAFIRAEEAKEGVFAATDAEYGQYQLKRYNCMTSFSSGMRHGDDEGSTLIQTYGFYAQIDIEYPHFDDLSDIEYLEYYLYNANQKDYAVQLYYPRTHTVSLPAGEWTRILIDTSLLDSADDIYYFTQIYSGNWNQGLEKDNAKFYMSSVKAVKPLITTGQDLYDHIADLRENGSTDEDAKSVIRWYNMLSDEEKAFVTNFDVFVKEYYLKRDGVDTTLENRLTYFDSEYGLQQLISRGNSCTTAYTTAMAYGSEKGSVLITATNQWRVYVGLAKLEEIDLSQYSYIEFYIYVENTWDYPVILGASRYNEGGEELVLEANRWNQVKLPLYEDRLLATDFLQLCGKDGNTGLDSSNYKFYISSIFALKEGETKADLVNATIEKLKNGTPTDADVLALIEAYEALGAVDRAEVVGYDEFLREYYLTRDNVPTDAADRITYFDSEYGLQQIEVRGSSASLAYEKAIAYGEESGSIRVSGKSGTGSSWRIYLGLLGTEAADMRKYEYIEFYIYVSNGLSVNDIEVAGGSRGGFNAGGTAIPLELNAWTKVRLPVPKNGLVTDTDMLCLQRKDSDNHGLDSENYVFYISAIYGIPYDIDGESLKAQIEELMDGEITQSDVDDVKSRYSLLSEEEQEKVTNYKPFLKAFYTARDGVPTEAEGRVTYFDSEYGTEQVVAEGGQTVGYATDKKYGNEKGSLLITGKEGAWNIHLRLSETEMSEFGKYKFIRFYIMAENPYADCLLNVGLDDANLNTGSAVPLTRGDWTEIVLPIPADGIVGKKLVLTHKDETNHGVNSSEYKFYISAIYAMEDTGVTGETLKAQIEELIAAGTISEEDFNAVNALYAALTEAEKEVVTNYKQFLKVYYLARDGVDTTQENRLTYFDSEYGLYQIEAKKNGSGKPYCMASYSPGRAYGDEKGSIMFTCTDQWNVYVGLTEVEYIDFTAYDYIEFYIYVENDYNYTMRIGANRYNEGGEEIVLQPNEWNHILLPLYEDRLLATDFFQFLGRDGNTGLDSPAYKFYISSIYARTQEEILTADIVNAMIEDLKGGAPTDENIDELIAAYESLSEEEQEKVIGYEAFLKDYYLERDGVDTTLENRLTYFDSEYGLRQIVQRGNSCTAAYTTARSFGSQSGSIVFTCGPTWNVYIGLTGIEDIDLGAYNFIEFYIYVENSYNYAMRIGASRYNEGGAEITLQPNRWNLVRLPMKADRLLDTDFLQLLGKDGNTGLDNETYKFYISSIFAVNGDISKTQEINETIAAYAEGNPTDGEVKDLIAAYEALSAEEQTEIIGYMAFLKAYYLARDGVDTTQENRLTYFDSEYGLYQIEAKKNGSGKPYCMASYSPGRAYGDEKGSIMFTCTDQWNVYVGLTEVEYIDFTAYDYIEFYIYVENDYNYTMRIGANRYNEGGEEIVLQPNEWNHILLPLYEDRLLATDFFQFLGRDENTGLNSPAYKFYISSIYAVTAETT